MTRFNDLIVTLVDEMDQGARIIGGKFGLEMPGRSNSESSISSFLPPGTQQRFVNARSALRVLVEHLDPPEIWLPSYVCPSLLQALGGFRNRLHFYTVSEKLEYPLQPESVRISKGALVILIEYFGFPASQQLIDHCVTAQADVLVDACQSLLCQNSYTGAYYSLYSIRKFFGVPDGGILIAPPDRNLQVEGLAPPPDQWLEQTVSALQLRREFDLGNTDSRDWFGRLQASEKEIPCGPFDMSQFSREMVERTIDAAEAASRRRNNFAILNRRLGRWSLFSNLPENVVPLGFPVRTSKRDMVRRKLFEVGIYPAIHWDLEGFAVEEFPESLKLSKEIMTLPCDQRYTSQDMARVAQAFESTMAESA